MPTIDASARLSSMRLGFASRRAIPSRTSCSVRDDIPRRSRSVARLGGALEVLERLDAELLVELLDGLRPDTGDVHELDERRRDLRPQPLVVGHPARRRELGDLVADRGADPGDAWRLACPVGGDEVDRAATDGVGRPVVGDGLEAELALDLEHVADLVEDPRQVAVRQAPVGAVALFLVVERDRLQVLLGTDQFVASWHVGDGSRPRASRPTPATTRSRPARFARYRARSASATSIVDRLVRDARDGNADRDADTRHAELAEVEGAHGAADPLADLDGHVAARVAQQDDELLAAVAGRHVVVTDRRHDRAGDRPQDLVADGMAVAVVERP